MQRPERQHLEDQEVERALRQVGLGRHDDTSGFDIYRRYVSKVKVCRRSSVLSYSNSAMTTTRRDFVRIAGTTTAAALLSSPAFGANEPALGLIFPPKDYPIPPDAKRLYPNGVEFLGDGVGLPGGMTIEGYEEAIPRVVPVAEALAKRGAKVISVFGSSITFYKGGHSTKS